MKVIVLSAKSSIRRPSLRRGFLLIPLVLVCFGLAPMAQAVGPDTDGSIPGSNNGEGIGVLVSRTSGVWNTGTGFEALNHLTAGNQNTATGLRALNSDINGGFNTATGVFSLFSNTSGFFNSATGAYSLAHNISGTSNTANGYAALYRNTADDNTATGFAALYHNTTGTDNTAVGASALGGNITGFQNVAMGSLALGTPTAGTASFNTALGFGAEQFDDGVFNTVVGYSSGQNLTAGFENIYIGDTIGAFSPAGVNEVNTIRIGDLTGFNGITQTFVGGIANSPQVWNGVTVCQVTVDFFGHLGVDCVNPSNPGATPQGPGQSAPVRPGAPQPRSPGAPAQPPTMRQAMLNDKVEKLEATVAQLKSTVAKQEATIAQQQRGMDAVTVRLNEQASQIQKVSAQLEVSKPAPRTASNK